MKSEGNEIQVDVMAEDAATIGLLSSRKKQDAPRSQLRVDSKHFIPLASSSSKSSCTYRETPGGQQNILREEAIRSAVSASSKQKMVADEYGRDNIAQNSGGCIKGQTIVFTPSAAAANSPMVSRSKTWKTTQHNFRTSGVLKSEPIVDGSSSTLLLCSERLGGAVSATSKTNAKVTESTLTSGILALTTCDLGGSSDINWYREQLRILEDKNESDQEKWSSLLLINPKIVYDSWLGEGASSSVYKGEINGTLVGIKEVKCAKSWFNELHSLKNVKHPNVIRLYGQAIVDNAPVLAMQICSYDDLYQCLRKIKCSENTLVESDVLKIALDVMKGMKYLHHDCKPVIIHGDIKLDNILLDKRGEDCTYIIADFGSARQKEGRVSETQYIAAYRAPEVWDSRLVSRKSDVWAFGILLNFACHEGCEHTCSKKDTKCPTVSFKQLADEREELRVQKATESMTASDTSRQASGVPQKSSILQKPVVPSIPKKFSAIRNLYDRCTEEDAEKRPYFSTLLTEYENQRSRETVGRKSL